MDKQTDGAHGHSSSAANAGVDNSAKTYKPSKALEGIVMDREALVACLDTMTPDRKQSFFESLKSNPNPSEQLPESDTESEEESSASVAKPTETAKMPKRSKALANLVMDREALVASLKTMSPKSQRSFFDRLKSNPNPSNQLSASDTESESEEESTSQKPK